MSRACGTARCREMAAKPRLKTSSDPAGAGLDPPSIIHAAPQFLQTGSLALGFEDALLQRARSWRTLSADLFSLAEVGRSSFRTTPLNRIQQSLTRELAVHRLGSRILHSHTQARRQMAERHRRRNFIDVLPARPAGAREFFLEIRLAQFHQTNRPIGGLNSERRNLLPTVTHDPRHPD